MNSNSEQYFQPHRQYPQPLLIMPLPESNFKDYEEFSQNIPKDQTFQDPILYQNQNISLGLLVEKMETESEGNDDIETNNMNSSCGLTILNKSSINDNNELDNEVFYEVYECQENTNIEQATLNFLKSLNPPFVFQGKDFKDFPLKEQNCIRSFKKIKVRANKVRNEDYLSYSKVEKRKGVDWEENEDAFIPKLKKLKV